MSELRWNPLLGEWLATATQRQDRTFLPPPDYCPLCPAKPGGYKTEVPSETYDIVAFENKFPSLKSHPDAPAIQPTDLYAVKPGRGVCEVVLYTSEHSMTFAQLPVRQIHKLVKVWRDRYEELGALDFVNYVFIFENKGKQIGVTLEHPHGQIYAYPYIPPVVQKELDQSLRHAEGTGRCLLCDIRDSEESEGFRIVSETEHFTSYIPFFARWPYEVHIISRRHFQSLSELTGEEESDLARIMKIVTSAYDRLFDISMPYIMSMHQAPTDGLPYDHYHFHIEFYPPLRTKEKLKYLAGSEAGAGMFINDTMAEEKALEMREAIAKHGLDKI